MIRIGAAYAITINIDASRKVKSIVALKSFGSLKSIASISFESRFIILPEETSSKKLKGARKMRSIK